APVWAAKVLGSWARAWSYVEQLLNPLDRLLNPFDSSRPLSNLEGMSKKLIAVKRAAERAAESREALHAAIREAASAHTLAEVAEAAGLTRQRVHQIAHSVRQRAALTKNETHLTS